jgi:hypothetical protein
LRRRKRSTTPRSTSKTTRTTLMATLTKIKTTSYRRATLPPPRAP